MKPNALNVHWMLRAAAGGIGFGRNVFGGLVHLVYPPFCLVCHGEQRRGDAIVCDGCLGTFPFIEGPLCQVCGAPLTQGDQPCRYCSGRPFSFSGARAAYVYSVSVRQVLHAFKFHRKVSLAGRFGRGLAFTVINDARFRDADCLVPVPLHPSRLRERGYNQSVLLAEAVCAELGIPCVKDALVRRKRTKSMTALNPRQRWRNVERAFEVVEGSSLKAKRVVLVDDVFTTGATVEACAQALLQDGTAEVHVLTVARALSFFASSGK